MDKKLYIYFNVESLTFIFSEHKKTKRKYISLPRDELMAIAKKNINSVRNYIIRHKISSSFFYFSTKLIANVSIDVTPDESQSVYRKPSGMWLSCGHSWLDHIEKFGGPNKYNLFTYTYNIELYSTVKIITDKESFFTFIKKYKKKQDDIRVYDIIDWDKVKADCHGLIITPHLGSKIWRENYESFYIHGREAAHDYFSDLLGTKWKNNQLLLAEWYRSWSCSGGVIWNTDAIASINLVKKTDYPKYIM
jgi:hypothetical protein